MSKTKIIDILAYDFLSDLKISDSAFKLAYKKTRANYDKNKYETDLWIYDIDKAINYPATDIKDASIFTFDKKDRLIYKAKSEETKDIFYKLGDHGVGKKAFSIKKNVSYISYLEDDLYLVIASDKKSKEKKDEEEKNKYFKEVTILPYWNNGSGYVVDDKKAYYLYDKREDKLKKIVEYDTLHSVGGLSLNEDNTKAIYFRGSYDDNKVMKLKEDLVLVDINTGKEKVLIKEEFSYYTVDFIEDRIIFVATNMQKGGINEDAFIYVSDYEGNYKRLTDDKFDMSFGNSLGTDVRYGGARTFATDSSKLYFLVTQKETTRLYSINLNGEIKLEIDDQVEDFAIKNGSIYYLSMGSDTLAEIKDKNGNVLVENKIKTELGKIETFDFESNGDTIKGFVMLPTNFDKDKKYPTLLSIHGGPKTELGEIFHHEHQVFANDGYIVIYTNPHGSSGNGVAYSDIRGLYGKKDYEDLMTFLDQAIERYPQIDSKNLGIYGGSYGGFMTNWTIGHTDRFKAACSQRSISNWTSFYGVSDIGYYFGSDQTDSTPWDNLEKMWDQSPIKYANKAKTPTLFIHADEDYRCPLEQGLQMYTKLKLNGVDTKMYVFHGEDHELSRSGKAHSRVKRLKEIKNWFDGYLK